MPESLRAENGDLIPGVVAGWRESFAMPAACPACGTPVVQEGKYWRCPNVYACEPQVIGRTLQMTHRSAFDVDGLGEKMVEQLFAAGHLGSPADLFYLDALKDELVELERWGEKKITNLLEQIERARHAPFERFLAALSIPEIGSADRTPPGRRTSTRSRPSWRRRPRSCSTSRASAPRWPRVCAPGSTGPRTRRCSSGCSRAAWRWSTPSPDSAGDGALAGKTVVFTGTLEELTRAEAKRLVERQGGRVVSSISAKTDFLVQGAGGGGKAKKAAALGVDVLPEAEFRELVEGADS